MGEMFFDTANRRAATGPCFRPYVPYTRQGSGIVRWQIPNPRIVHTLKDENYGNNSAASLRCPQRTANTTDYYIDGIYNLTWFSAASAKVLKVPNHCSVVRNYQGYATCCTLVLIPIWGSVTFNNPRDSALTDWPDNPRICSNRE